MFFFQIFRRAARNRISVLFIVENGHQIIGRPTAAVITHVDHNAVFAVARSRKLSLKAFETCPAHRFDVEITQFAAGIFFG